VAEGALFRGAGQTNWTYPAAFANGTTPTLTASAVTEPGVWISTLAGDHLSGGIAAYAAASKATAPQVTVTAVGQRG